MPEDRGMSRRKVLGIGAATLASTALDDIVTPAAALAGTGPRGGSGTSRASASTRR